MVGNVSVTWRWRVHIDLSSLTIITSVTWFMLLHHAVSSMCTYLSLILALFTLLVVVEVVIGLVTRHLSVNSVKCYPGGPNIELIPTIPEILSQTWCHCVQYTRRHHMSLVPFCQHHFPHSWLIWICYLLLRWPGLLAVQAIIRINKLLK